MLLASTLSGLTDHVTSAIGDYGLYAVFVLMAVDALFPAASEVVMVYAGAVASGAFADQHIVLFGTTLNSGLAAYLAVALAGTLGYTLGSIVGWAIGVYGGRPYLERHGRWLHLDAENLERAERWFERWGGWAVFLGRITPVVRSFVSIPAGVLEIPFVRYTLLTLAGSAIWCFGLAGLGWARRRELGERPQRLQVRRLPRGRRRRGGRRVARVVDPQTPAATGRRGVAGGLTNPGIDAAPATLARVTQPIPLIDVKAQYAPLLPQIKAAIDDVLDKGTFVFGPNVTAFEEEAARYLGVRETIGVGNGTDAIVLVLNALEIGAGDEVICPAFTFYASAEAIARAGRRPSSRTSTRSR